MDTSTITVPRSNVTADEVTAVLRGRLGSRYTITPGKRGTGFGKEVSGDANSLLVHPRDNNTDVISWRDATSSTQTPSR
jgi:hypothetical protein